MSMSEAYSSSLLCARLSRWRAARLLRFCFVLALGEDPRRSGFNVNQNLAQEVSLLWPISALVATLAPLQGQMDRIGGWLRPFTIEFLNRLSTHLHQQADEDARVQFLWLGMASKKGPEKLLERIARLFSKSLTPPAKRQPFRSITNPNGQAGRSAKTPKNRAGIWPAAAA